MFQGKVTFLLVPPSDNNLKSFESWSVGGKQDNGFFADTVEHCSRLTLEAGHTLFIPSGWIYAIYTWEDTIAFSGNFLHSYAMEKQLQIAHLEEVLHLPARARFPFFTELLWFVLDRYIHCVLGKTFLDLPEEEKRRIRLEKGEAVDPNEEVFKLAAGHASPPEKMHLTVAELNGIKFAVMYLHHLPASKKNVPLLLPDPIGIVKGIRNTVLEHKDDCPDQAVSGKYVLRWGNHNVVKKSRKVGKSEGTGSSKRKSMDPGAMKVLQKRMSGANRRRRVRCKTCPACVGGDCRSCVYCKDMVKYGGPGRMKQTCEKVN